LDGAPCQTCRLQISPTASLGGYVLAFYCPTARLAIEVDGIVHNMGTNPEHDVQRDDWLQTQAVKTLRFAATDVLNELDGVVRAITAECTTRSSSDG
jgi:very-short-patch-repair endonuclease